MKKLIIIFLFLFLFLNSCSLYEKDIKNKNQEIKDVFNDNNFNKCIEKNKNKFKDTKEIVKFCMNNTIVENNTDNYNFTWTWFNINLDLKVWEIDFRKFEWDINKIIFPISYDIYIWDNNSKKLKIFLLNNKSDFLSLYFTKYNDNDFYIINNMNFNKLRDLYLDLWWEYKSIDKTLTILSEKLKNKWKWFSLSLDFKSYSLIDKDEKLLTKMNISKLLLSWFSPRIDYSNSNEWNILKYKNDILVVDKKIKNILNNSKTLNEIIVQDYKIFTKKDWKIEIKDIRMNK